MRTVTGSTLLSLLTTCFCEMQLTKLKNKVNCRRAAQCVPYLSSLSNSSYSFANSLKMIIGF